MLSVIDYYESALSELRAVDVLVRTKPLDVLVAVNELRMRAAQLQDPVDQQAILRFHADAVILRWFAAYTEALQDEAPAPRGT